MRTAGVFGFLLMACAEGSPSLNDLLDVRTVSVDWTRTNSSCGYDFLARPGLVEDQVPHVGDSCISTWTVDGCRYSGDYGFYSVYLEPFEEMDHYETGQETINGRPARLLSGVSKTGFEAAVHFPVVDSELNSTLQLTVWSICKSKAGHLNALRSFRTIEFSR